MSLHVEIFHMAKVSPPVYHLGAPIILKADVHCVCGFKTNSGNKMGT